MWPACCVLVYLSTKLPSEAWRYLAIKAFAVHLLTQSKFGLAEVLMDLLEGFVSQL